MHRRTQNRNKCHRSSCKLVQVFLFCDALIKMKSRKCSHTQTHTMQASSLAVNVISFHKTLIITCFSLYHLYFRLLAAFDLALTLTELVHLTFAHRFFFLFIILFHCNCEILIIILFFHSSSVCFWLTFPSETSPLAKHWNHKTRFMRDRADVVLMRCHCFRITYLYFIVHFIWCLWVFQIHLSIDYSVLKLLLYIHMYTIAIVNSLYQIFRVYTNKIERMYKSHIKIETFC